MNSEVVENLFKVNMLQILDVYTLLDSKNTHCCWGHSATNTQHLVDAALGAGRWGRDILMNKR